MGDHGIVQKALNSLGKGFDLTSSFRLKFCKGNNRLILLNETDTQKLSVPGFGSIDNVSIDVKCDKGERTRYQSDILSFNQMSELFNQKSSVIGKIPNGNFNSMFGFESGSWSLDGMNTKNLAFDGYFIVLFNVHIDRYPLILCDQVRNDVPSTWDPSALGRFIEKYGTHIIVGLSIGGHDVVSVKQEKSSKMEPSKLKNELYCLGDQLFTGTCMLSPHQTKTKYQRNKVSQPFNVFDQQSNILSSFESVTTRDGISVICSKRGGDSSVNTHCEWLLSVPSMPDAINFTFIPITSLLKGVPGKSFLSHAINLYLRYKPPIGDLEYFLDFQMHRVWAPIHSDLPMGPTRIKAHQISTLNFNLMGPKLYVNTAQVIVGNLPVTGIRFYLEGIKRNRLGIHLQHLTNPPIHLRDKLIDVKKWRGSDEILDHHRYLEPIQWKKFSHVCTAPVRYDLAWSCSDKHETFIVTGAQLVVTRHDTKKVLHLRLAYSKIIDTRVIQSTLMQGESRHYNSTKSGLFSSAGASMSNNVENERSRQVIVDSAVYPTGPPLPVQTQLSRLVDTTQLCKGPLDSPGHWLVTGAKLDMEKGKICLRVKFSLLKTI